MNAIVSNEYADAVKRIRDSPLFTHMMYKQKAIAGKRIIDLTDAEMVSEEVTHESGQATHTFMMAASRQFAKLEEMNPTYAVDGFRAIGTVSEAILGLRNELRQIITRYFKLTDEQIDARLTAGENISEIMTDEMDRKVGDKK